MNTPSAILSTLTNDLHRRPRVNQTQASGADSVASPDEYRAQISALGLDKASLSASTAAEAKQALLKCRRFQGELRLIKKAVSLEMKVIRAASASEAASAGSLTAGAFSLFGKRGIAGRIRADAKRSVRASRDRELQPYENLKLMVDDLLHQLDAARLRFQHYLAEAKREASDARELEPGSDRVCARCAASISAADNFCPQCGAAQRGASS
jgi:hypothetical protein